LINGFIAPVGDADKPDYMMAVTPLQFDEKPVGKLKRGPKYGEHTDEILAEIGCDQADLAKLRSDGTIL
jgi:crotonobetainyl-CoA:carnitine CoA-transferase CaiB-like acyl-CoA transferase